MGADLGDPLHVSLSNGRVLVAGTGIAPARQQQIHTALDSLPLVAVEFSDPAVSVLPPDAGSAAPATVAQASPAPFQSRLETLVGGRALFDRLAGQVLTWNETLMAHAYALRSLARQFPDDTALNAADRASLHAIASDHLSAMGVPSANYESSLVPLLADLGAASHARPASSDSAWQTSSEHLFQAAVRAEMLSSMLLGVARGEKANAELPSDLLGAVSELRAHLEQNQRLLGR
jgi:hypothetical protein